MRSVSDIAEDALSAPELERRAAPRVRMSLACTLRPRTSSPIWAETIDVGLGGMSVRATRPLRADALVDFDLAESEESHVTGEARVMRLAGPRVYGLRFERLREPMPERLRRLVHGAR
jgi:c-di-GMP-binding flagellar brake protein YcgR